MKTTLFLTTAVLSFGCGTKNTENTENTKNACEELGDKISECTGTEVQSEDDYSDEEIDDCQETLDNWETVESVICPDEDTGGMYEDTGGM